MRFSMLWKGCATLALLGALSASFSSAQAAPRGPSAKAAAKLKKAPPNTYLKHYLPDDRYKIAGGVWKFVSTDLDRYYHIPSSPNMLRQSPNRVIGFASAKDAEEAGYIADPTDGTARRVAGERIGALGGAGLATSTRSASATAGAVNLPAGSKVTRATRVLLSDRVSSLVLPAGWRRTATTSEVRNGATSALDNFVSPSGERVRISRVIAFQNPQGGPGVEAFLKPEFFNGLSKSSGSFKQFENATGAVNSKVSRATTALDNVFEGLRAYPVRFGGYSGVGLKLKGGRNTSMAGFGQIPGLTYMVGRGNMMIVVEDFSKSNKAAVPLLKTFRTQ